MKITVPASTLRDIQESATILIRIEPASKCYGDECGSPVFDDQGELQLLAPHEHLVVSGRGPDARSRTFLFHRE